MKSEILFSRFQNTTSISIWFLTFSINMQVLSLKKAWIGGPMNITAESLRYHRTKNVSHSKDSPNITPRYQWVPAWEVRGNQTQCSLHLRNYPTGGVRLEWLLGPCFDGLESDQRSDCYHRIAVSHPSIYRANLISLFQVTSRQADLLLKIVLTFCKIMEEKFWP